MDQRRSADGWAKNARCITHCLKSKQLKTPEVVFFSEKSCVNPSLPQEIDRFWVREEDLKTPGV